MSRQVRHAVLVLVLAEFLVCLGLSLVFPVMPFLKTSLNLSATSMGIMNALFALAQFIASPIVGRISDNIGRKPVIVAGLFLYMISEFVFAMTNQLIVFDISRVLGGLSAAMVVPTSMALAADLTTKRQRAKVIGWLSASLSGGLILGPGIGGLLANISYKAPFWAAGGLCFVSLIATVILLPNHVAADVQEEEVLTETTTKDWKQILNHEMIVLLIMILVSAFGLQGYESIYSIYAHEVFDFSLNNIALVLTLNGLISLFFQVFLFDRLVVWLKEVKLIRYCFLFGFAGVIWNIMAHSKLEVILATLVIFTAFDLIRPAITTLLTKISSTNQGLINGLNMSLTSIGNIAGPILSGVLLDINYHYPYMVVATFLGLSFLITYRLKIKVAS